MKCFIWLLLGLCGTACLGHGQTSSEEPAQAVLVFLSDPSEFASLEMDGEPFGSLSLSADFAGVWPVEPGKRQLKIKAADETEAEFTVQFVSGQTVVLFLGLQDAAGGGQRKISGRTLPLSLPKPKFGTRKIYAVVAPGSGGIAGKVMRGGDKFVDVQLSAGKLELLGEGETVFKVGNEVIVSGNPETSGNYVFILIPEADKKVRSVAFSNLVYEEEKQPTP
jgi:hypothetical protein